MLVFPSVVHDQTVMKRLRYEDVMCTPLAEQEMQPCLTSLNAGRVRLSLKKEKSIRGWGKKECWVEGIVVRGTTISSVFVLFLFSAWIFDKFFPLD